MSSLYMIRDHQYFVTLWEVLCRMNIQYIYMYIMIILIIIYCAFTLLCIILLHYNN